MNIRSTILLAMAALASTALACATSGGGSGSGASSTDAGSDAAKDGIVAVDVLADGKAGSDAGAGADTAPGADSTAGGDTATGGDTGSTNACCAAKGATCGFVPGCPQSCGGCPLNKICDTKAGSATQYKCIDKPASKPLKKNGESCGPNAECKPPGNNASNAVQQAYFQCLHDQCENGRCFAGVCSKQCKIASDKKNNSTGADLADGDGIEDPDATSECTGFVDGPAGSSFKCVDIFAKADPNQLALCTPGTTFAPCKANADCKNGEVCAYRQIRGGLQLVCAPPYKEADGKPGVTLANPCNNNPLAGKVATCKNNVCLTLGCVDFCKGDDDCVTNPGACQGGKCATTGAACSKDADCSAWFCKKDQKFFGKDAPAIDVCVPKNCYLDEDCKNPDYYCLSSYNGVDNQDGDPDPKDPSKVILPSWEQSVCVKKAPGTAKKGEACDDFPNDDDVTLKPCENKFWCIDGMCLGHCKEDKDCPTNSKCGVIDYSFDTSDPPDKKIDVYTAWEVCQPMPGATKDCEGQGDCKGEAKAKHCKYIEVEPATPSPDYKYTMKGMCVEPNPNFSGVGGTCGQVPSKSCNSGVCLATQNQKGEPQAGWCAEACNSKADCPLEITFEAFNNQKAKAYCRTIGWGNNATKHPYDNLYLSICYPALGSSTVSVADCSADFKCPTSEACVPIAVGAGPDKPMKTEFHCLSLLNQDQSLPTKKVGESCDPDPPAGANEECASGQCMPDSTTGKGYCSAVCKDNAACGSNDSMFCDVDHQIVPRKDPKMAAIAPMCLKKKSCIPCAYDFQCATSYLCTWPDAKKDTGSCAPPCQTDADCAKTDGGGKCEAQKDINGKATALKVCTPTACK